MEIDEIKKLMELMKEKGVIELEIKNASGEVRLVREPQQAVAPPSPVVVATAPSMPHPFSTQLVIPSSQSNEQSATETSSARGVAIPSPMVGTFYRAPSPETKPYVDVDSIVEIGDVVCIVEAMKMMNEIQAEVRGRVLKIMAENGKAVEYGQPLFLLDPL